MLSAKTKCENKVDRFQLAALAGSKTMSVEVFNVILHGLVKFPPNLVPTYINYFFYIFVEIKL
jgi:hypothetical protein